MEFYSGLISLSAWLDSNFFPSNTVKDDISYRYDMFDPLTQTFDSGKWTYRPLSWDESGILCANASPYYAFIESDQWMLVPSTTNTAVNSIKF